MSARFPNQAAAKQFFIDRIVFQAGKDGVALAEVEKQMLAWSEAEMTPVEAIELGSRFEKETTNAELERKISALVKKAYKEDVARDAGARRLYLEAYRVLIRGTIIFL